MKTVLILSGGLDSTVLLYKLARNGGEVRALSINYGQRHVRELGFAAKNCARLGVEHKIIDLSALRDLLGGSSQTDANVPVPHGHYAAENMKLTVVPNRNMMLLAAAAAWAVSSRSDAVAYAAHAGDHAQYPDCRQVFIDALASAIALCDWSPIALHAPFAVMSKADIVKLGASLDVPFAETWSCYEGGERHCGRCGTCYERRLAFEEANVPDPTDYVDAVTRFVEPVGV